MADDYYTQCLRVETVIAEQARRQGTTPERLISESLQKLFAVLTPDEISGLAGQVYMGSSGGQAISLSDHGIGPA